MSPIQTPALSPNEWKIMKILWEKKACATRDILAIAGEAQGWTRSTVKTFLRRLVEKGYVKTTQVGNSYLYKPARPALKSFLHAADTLLENTVQGMAGPVAAHIVRNADLSEEDIQQLQAILDEHAARKGMKR